MPAVLSIGPVGFRRAVERLAVREDPRLGELVESVDKELGDEEEEEDGR